MVRFKNRYLLVKIDTDSREAFPSKTGLGPHEFSTTIKDQIVDLFGECGMGFLAMSHSIKYYQPDIGLAIVRSSREGYRKTWAAISCIKEIRGICCALRIIHISGTIRQCQKAALKHLKTLELDKKTVAIVQDQLSKLQE